MKGCNGGKRCRYKTSGLKRKSALKNLQEFSENTTLHGIRYIGEPHRHILERLCWLLIVIACTGGCIFYILTLLQRWNTSPVIVTFAERSTPIWDIPFPAVTICPDNKIPKSRYAIPNITDYKPVVFRGPAYSPGRGNYTNNLLDLYNISQSEYEENLNQSFSYNIRSLLDFDSPLFEDLNDDKNSMNESMQWQAASMLCQEMKHEFILNRTHVKEYLKMATNSDRFLHCRWGSSENVMCDYFFRPILTDLGMCYTFNMIEDQEMFKQDIDVHNDLLDDVWFQSFMYSYTKSETLNSWDPHLGYLPSDNREAYPRRVAGKGARSGLDIVFNSRVQELQPVCWPNAKSYKMLLHSPAEFPKMSDQHFRIPINSLVTVAVRPTMVTTSEALRAGGYSPQVRGCYFPDERQLKYFKVYTQGNCEMECLTAKITQNCECVPFYLPRLKTDNIKYCSSLDADCIQNTEYSMTWGSETVQKFQQQCNCLPSCTEYKYDMELSSTQIDRDEVAGYVMDPAFASMDQSKITIHFKETQFITSQRREQYGMIDFIANCGGLLGLFTGFSLISAIEIVYYVTVRMFCHFRKRKELDNDDTEK